MYLIGIGGNGTGAGKDEVKKILTQLICTDKNLKQQLNIWSLNYADRLKEEVSKMLLPMFISDLGWSSESTWLDVFNFINSSSINESTGKKCKEQFRILMQWWGTEWRRELCDSDYWIKHFNQQLDNTLLISNYTNNIVFTTDLRFPNEMSNHQAYFHGSNFQSKLVTIYVKRKDNPNGFTQHKSEGGLNPQDFDYVIENDGTLEELQEKVAQLYNHLKQNFFTF